MATKNKNDNDKPAQPAENLTASTVLNALPFYAWIKDIQGRFLLVNEEFAKACGQKSAEELVGKGAPLACPEHLAATALPSGMEAALAEGMPQETEETILAGENGTWFSTTKTIMLDGEGNALGTLGFASDITDKIESQQRFEKMFQENPAPMVITTPPERRYFDVNEAFLQKFGYTREEVIGKTSIEIGLFTNPGQQANYAYKIRQGQSVVNMEMAMATKSRAPLQGLLSVQHIRIHSKEYYLVVMVDITERKQMEQVFASNEHRMRALLSSMDDIIFVLSEDLVFLECHQPDSAKLLMPPEEFIGKSIDEIQFQDPARQTIKEALQKTLRTGTMATAEYSLDLPECICWFEMRATTYTVSSQKKLAAVVRNTTERKRIEIYQDMSAQVLNILNSTGSLHELIRRIIGVIQETTGFDAVGIRLQQGEDYPYFSQAGFSTDFLLSENTLIERGPEGCICRGADGKPCLECTCGLVISGKTDPGNPSFTPGGSFWANDTLPLLDLPRDKDPRHNPRNTCIHKGYASVALVPIRSNNQIIGLLQLNDQHKGRFSAASVAQLEMTAAHLGEALLRKRAEEELQLANDRLRQLSITDELTGLYNRRGFFEVARHLFHAAKRYKKPLSLLFCDLDKLKTINDTGGHEAGDIALKDTARALSQSMRASDVVARVGGDEFVVLLPQTNELAAHASLGRVHAALEAINNTRKTPLTLSIGARQVDPETMHNIDDLLSFADAEMYRAKSNKKPAEKKPRGEDKK